MLYLCISLGTSWNPHKDTWGSLEPTLCTNDTKQNILGCELEQVLCAGCHLHSDARGLSQ